MRNREGYEEKRSYVRMNPVRAELTATADTWPWQGEYEPILW